MNSEKERFQTAYNNDESDESDEWKKLMIMIMIMKKGTHSPSHTHILIHVPHILLSPSHVPKTQR